MLSIKCYLLNAIYLSIYLSIYLIIACIMYIVKYWQYDEVSSDNIIKHPSKSETKLLAELIFALTASQY